MKKLTVIIMVMVLIGISGVQLCQGATDHEKTIRIIEKLYEVRNQQFLFVTSAYIHENERAGIAIEIVVYLLECESKGKPIDQVKLNNLLDTLEVMTDTSIAVNKDMEDLNIWGTWEYLIKRDSQ